jgi:hypothetical protein
VNKCGICVIINLHINKFEYIVIVDVSKHSA